jgi:dTDP-4-dehydrorhamnose reductase
MKRGGFLVVGADSMLGSHLLHKMTHRGYNVLGTSRRRDSLTPHRVFLDFEHLELFPSIDDMKYAFVIATVADYARCEADENARRVNVEAIPACVKTLLEKGLFVTFISTNTVFGGERPWPNENDPHDPKIAYAVQKAEAELAIKKIAEKMRALDRFAIVRLTKIVSIDTSPLPNWFQSLKANEPITPFSDLIFAPISLDYVAESLITIAESGCAGNLHLSGAKNISYTDFACALVDKLGLSRDLVQSTTSIEKGIKMYFAPTYSGLGMERTTQLIKLEPEMLNTVVKYLIDQDCQKNKPVSLMDLS